MRWADPEWRWIALGLVALASLAMLWGVRARRLAVTRFGDLELVRALRDGAPAGWRTARGVMALIALALVALAAGRPQGRARTDVVARRGIDIALQ